MSAAPKLVLEYEPIHTEYIGLLGFWQAWIDPEGMYGWAKTEAEAIADLKEQEEEWEAERRSA